MLNLPYKLVLGSQSPRRRSLLKRLDLPFETRLIPDIDESYPADIPLDKVPRFLAEAKARSYISTLASNELLITADTVVLLGEKLLGKPSSREEASAMLGALAGNWHRVVTGVSFSRPQGICYSMEAESRVLFATLSDEEINYYLDHYHPYDKAGSYGIQEWIGFVAIRAIEGSFYNVMGLPIHLIYQTLREWAEKYEPCKSTNTI